MWFMAYYCDISDASLYIYYSILIAFKCRPIQELILHIYSTCFVHYIDWTFIFLLIDSVCFFAFCCSRAFYGLMAHFLFNHYL